MNIKVAAFTVSEKSSNIKYMLVMSWQMLVMGRVAKMHFTGTKYSAKILLLLKHKKMFTCNSHVNQINTV